MEPPMYLRGANSAGRGRGRQPLSPAASTPRSVVESDALAMGVQGARDSRVLSLVSKPVGRPAASPAASVSQNAAAPFSASTHAERVAVAVAQQKATAAAASAASIYEESSDDSSGEEFDGVAVINATFKNYRGVAGSDAQAQIERTRQLVHDACTAGSQVCLVCIGSIRRADAVWNCSVCFCMYHITCVQAWVRDGIARKELETAANPDLREVGARSDQRDRPRVWCCPKCRAEYDIQTHQPSKYVCFCGKAVDPSPDPWLVPHSCGEVCGRALPGGCGHRCLLLCHPGPCPPCPQMLALPCHCGKLSAQRRCGSKPHSCSSVCAKVLGCGEHRCDKVCHAGVCDECRRTSVQKCRCGKASQLRACNDADYMCGSPCGKTLSCGFHACDKICHVGACGSCKMEGARSCPCGKKSAVLACTDPDVDPCGDSCGRTLACGVHLCVRRCHRGPCDICRHEVERTCRCGATRRRAQCCEGSFQCERKCGRTKECGRHTCKRRCCDGNCPPCEETCGRRLACGNHKCAAPCHSGPCYPCQLTIPVTCRCERSVIEVPCGGEAAAKPPKCRHACSVPTECDHMVADRPPHACHFGRCPRCRLPCAKVHAACGHRCDAQCHVYRPIALPADAIAGKGMLSKREAKEIAKAQPPPPDVRQCPPCTVPVSISCRGKHEVVPMPCSEAREFDCGRACGKPLPCGNHTCDAGCHLPTTTCRPCERACEHPRAEHCKHPCPRPCHAGPCPPCVGTVRVKCHCENVVLSLSCSEYVKAMASAEASARLFSCNAPCSKAKDCGHPCNVVCHAGQCALAASCTKRTAMRCPCKRKKKEFVCREIDEIRRKIGAIAPLLECDEDCEKAKAAVASAEAHAAARLVAEEHKRQQAELELYNRKLNPTGRKRKTKETAPVDRPWLDAVNWSRLGGILVALSLVLLVYWIFNE